MILFIDNYDSFIYNLVDYIGRMKLDVKVVRNDEIQLSEIATLKPAGIIISPGPGMPGDAGISCALIREYYQSIPIFGVCLGYQAIGQVFGANIIRASYPVHGKTSNILHNGRGVFKGIVSPMIGTRYHSLIIKRASLPDCLEITAETEDGLIMGIAHREFPVCGVQFHPESILTTDGIKLMTNWVEMIKQYNLSLDQELSY